MNYTEILLFFFTLATAFYYAYLISSIFDGWQKTEETLIQKPVKNYHHFTIIVPARNEADKIKDCIISLQNLSYPPSHFKVLVIDDHSEDDTSELASSFDFVKVIRNKGIGKKNALETGVHEADTDYIITIDADCMVHPDLLLLYNQKLIDHPDLQFIAGGVIFSEKKSLLGWFQSLDILSLMASTAYGIQSGYFYIANGANMCFKRDTFIQLKSYAIKRNISSGDDVFLINNIARSFSDRAISFLKSRRGAVITAPETSIKNLASQRFRWASKTQDYANNHLIHLQGMVFFIHIYGLALFILSFWFPLAAFYLILLLLIKASIDYLFLRRMAYFYQIKWYILGFITTSLLYYPYIFFMAFAALVKGTYTWKGRIVK